MIHLYGIIISFAILVATLVAEKQVKKDKQNVERYWGYVLVCIVGGLIGARLYHVVSALPYYLENPLEILHVYNGGMSIFGGVVGGFIASYIYARKNKYTLLSVPNKTEFGYFMAIAASVMPLAQAIGRFANYVNHELYGPPSTLPWAIFIPLENRLKGFENFSTFHPLFAYEALLNLILFAYLSTAIKKNKSILGIENKIIGSYLIGYGIIRFLLEFIRIDTWKINGINVAQIVTLLFICIGTVILRKQKL